MNDRLKGFVFVKRIRAYRSIRLRLQLFAQKSLSTAHLSCPIARQLVSHGENTALLALPGTQHPHKSAPVFR
jgi:hypothetical protein